MPSLAVYLDNSATTPVDPRVAAQMLPWLTSRFANAASTHAPGREARAAVETARAEVAALIHAEPHEIVWTSGATESDNLALKGAALALRPRGAHILSVQTEHRAVLDTLGELTHQGFDATLLAPGPDGLLDVAAFAAAIRPDTVLASVMLVNNEIGVIQDVAALGAICRRHGIVFHVDAAQASGRVEIDVRRQCIDLMSLTAHKTYGPKGVGALYVRDGVALAAQMHGGGHERGIRSGTLATHQIVGMGACFRIAGEEMHTEVPRLRALRDRLHRELSALEGVSVNGDMRQRIAGNLNISLALPDCSRMIAGLTDIAVSSAAACASEHGAVSHVLRALGSDAQRAACSIRITVGRFNTEEEIDFAVDYLKAAIRQCAAPAPISPSL